MNLKIDKPIRLIELFAGIGSQAKALERLGANFEHYRICEFDKYAIKSYNAIHGTDFATSDITKITAEDLGIVDTEDYCYIVTYSFPCQDLSLAGKGKGMAKGDGTRSGLLWEVERLLNECEELPQILLMENVTQVHGTKNKEHFEEWIHFLESKGYRNFWKDLNAKNFGIPQNRNRCFMVSVLGDYTYEFPKEFPLEFRLKDMLETEVDEKFYLSDVAIQGRMQSSFRQYNLERSLINEKEIHPTILARFEGSPTLLKEPMVIAGIGEKKSNGGTQWYQQDRVYEGDVAISVTTAFNPYYAVDEPKIQKVCQLEGSHDQSGRVYSPNGISPTVMSNSHGNTSGGYTSPKVIDPFIVASRGRNPENPSDRRAGIPTEQRLEPNFSGCSNTLTTVQKDNYVAEPIINRIDIPQTVRVRKNEVDCEKLCAVLRDCKNSSGLNNQDIANRLNIPLTKAEHWFRQDKYFAIPDENIWFELKALIGVNTDEFDEAITTFEEKEGVFEKSNRCYFPNGISPTITSASADEKIIEPQSCLIQPKDRAYKSKGLPRETQFEVKNDGLAHSLRTNSETMVAEPQIKVVGNYSPSGHEASRVVSMDGLAPTVKENHGTVTAVMDPVVCEQRRDEGLRFFKGDYCGALRTIDACGDKRGVESCDEIPSKFRIRKLTPKECWRLMGFDDSDFEKAALVNSNTQLYKQAGNSIVVDVLYYIFKNMLEGSK